jgi:hypothetical protein
MPELKINKALVSCPITHELYQSTPDAPEDSTDTSSATDHRHAKKANAPSPNRSRKPIQLTGCGCIMSEGAYAENIKEQQETENELKCPVTSCNTLINKNRPWAYNYVVCDIAEHYQAQCHDFSNETAVILLEDALLECALNMERFSLEPNDPPALLTNCGHTFSSVETNKLRKPACPVCRTDIVQDSQAPYWLVNNRLRALIAQRPGLPPLPQAAIDTIIRFMDPPYRPPLEAFLNSPLQLSFKPTILLGLFAASASSLGMIIINLAGSTLETERMSGFLLFNLRSQMISSFSYLFYTLFKIFSNTNEGCLIRHHLVCYFAYTSIAPFLAGLFLGDSFDPFFTNSPLVDFMIASNVGTAALGSVLYSIDRFCHHHNARGADELNALRRMAMTLYLGTKQSCFDLLRATGMYSIAFTVLHGFTPGVIQYLASRVSVPIMSRLFPSSVYNALSENSLGTLLSGALSLQPCILSGYFFLGFLSSLRSSHYREAMTAIYLSSMGIAAFITPSISLSVGYETLVCHSPVGYIFDNPEHCQSLASNSDLFPINIGIGITTTLIILLFSFLALLLKRGCGRLLEPANNTRNQREGDEPLLDGADEQEQQADQNQGVIASIYTVLGFFPPPNASRQIEHVEADEENAGGARPIYHRDRCCIL